MSFDPTRPFSRTAALAAGVSAWQLRGFRRLVSGVYIDPAARVDVIVLARAALLRAPQGTRLARHTAAAVMGGVIPEPRDVHLALPSGRLRVQGIDARPTTATRTAHVRGLPVIPAEETFVELADELGLVDLVVLGDSLVRRGRTTPGQLVRWAALAPERVRPLARRAAGLVRQGVDSPMETRLRLLLVLAGLPEPVVNHVEYDVDGSWRRRFDLAYPWVQVAVEYDGRQHAESDRQWQHDVTRREGMDEDGWRLVVVLAEGIYRDPERTLDRVERTLRQRGMVAAVTSDEWRAHFPSRRPVTP